MASKDLFFESITNARDNINADREQFFQSITNARDNNIHTSQSSIPKIQKVPFMLKGTKNFDKHFVPRVVSIGPFHHRNNEHLKLGEALKLKFTGDFMAGKENELRAVYDKILEDIDSLRICYNEEEVEKVIPSKEELAQVLFLGGCSVLHYIYCFVNGGLNKYMIRDRDVAFVQQDLFLLENQLPFQVLKLLINAKYDTSRAPMVAASNRYEEKVGMEMIEDFIQNKIEIPWYGCRPGSQPIEEEHFDHLLDLLRKRLVGSTHQQNLPDHNNRGLTKRNWIHNVSELTAAGIYLKPSRTYFVKNVSFTSQIIKGVLKLPWIKVEDSTGSMFLNLIAYEMSPGVKTNMEVTTYICLLDSLIDHPDDVKQLREAGILHNFLFSDEKVAHLFNEIGTDLVPNDKIYKQVKSGIQNHYDNEKKKAMAQFYHTHFSTPWTIIAFVWGLIAILLTAITSFFSLARSRDECNGLCKQLKSRYT